MIENTRFEKQSKVERLVVVGVVYVECALAHFEATNPRKRS